MSATSTFSDTAAPFKNLKLSFRARAIGTHMLFAVLTTVYWCKIIGTHQLAFFRNLRAHSERNVGNTYSRSIWSNLSTSGRCDGFQFVEHFGGGTVWLPQLAHATRAHTYIQLVPSVIQKINSGPTHFSELFC